MYDQLKMRTNFNRTELELKHDSAIYACAAWLAFNRTELELKLVIRIEGVKHRLTFNRTELELKHQTTATRCTVVGLQSHRIGIETKSAAAGLERNGSFNRTELELKPFPATGDAGKIYPSIAPNWN